MPQFVEVSRQAAVATVTIQRPDKLNALSQEVLGDLEAAVAELASDEALRAAIVTGAGKAFVAGADIAAMKDMSEQEGREFAAFGHRVFDAIEQLRFPVIAAVNGFALGGGCELALACDFIYASSKARFGQPEVGLGIVPGFGGTQRLARRVGAAMAKELIFTGRMIDAEVALRLGLANAVFPPDALIASAEETATEVAKKGPLAVAAAKRLIVEGIEKPLASANALEQDAFGAGFRTDDQSEGMSAFLEKRAPRFTGG